MNAIGPTPVRANPDRTPERGGWPTNEAIREAIESVNRFRAGQATRPDGFDQHKIDEIKTTMLATGKRSKR